MQEQVLEFQQMLLKVQESCNQAEALDLVFLCTDLLRKNLSGVDTTRELFTLLQKYSLLSSDDPSLLIELLTITHRHSLLNELHLKPSLSSNHISSYRRLLFELAENITEDDLKTIKFLLYKKLPTRTLDKDLTLLQLFLEMEKRGHLDAENLDMLEKIIGGVNPSVLTKISQFKEESLKCGASVKPKKTKWKDKADLQDISCTTTTIPVQPESITQNGDTSYASCSKGVECTDLQSSEKPLALSSLSGDAVVPQMAELSLTESARPDDSQVQFHNLEFHSRVEEKALCSSSPIQQSNLKLEQYDMKGDWRGYCLIINNYDFSKSKGLLCNRNGSDIDQKSLETVFHWLGFTILREKDCSRKDILKALENLRELDHSEADCVVCCVLTHGYDGGVHGVYGEKVELRELMEPLYGLNCRSLSEKPKLFFLQACQGTNHQGVVFLQSDGPNNNTEMGIFCDAAVPKQSIPSAADFLMAVSTVPTFVSYRDTLKGSWFIQSLCENLKKLVPWGIDLLSIMTRVNNDVSRKTDKSGTKKQIPQPGYTLRKRVVFPVPKIPFKPQEL